MTIKDILDVLGFDVKLVNVVIARDKDSPARPAQHSPPRATIVEITKIQRDLPSHLSITRPEMTPRIRRRIR